MSRGYSDEFVIFPGSKHHTVKLDIRHDGSRDPACCNVSGRQHRPAEPEHGALRYGEDVEIRDTSGPGHEKEPNVVSVPIVTGRPSGTPVNRPGKSVDFGPRVGPECSASVAAMLGVTSALRKGLGEYGRANGFESVPTDSLASAHTPAFSSQPYTDCCVEPVCEFSLNTYCT